MKKEAFSIIILLILILSSISVSAFGLVSIGDVDRLDCIRLFQTCDNCTYINITSVLYPNKTVSISNKIMSKFDDTEFNYTFCDTNETGTYIVNTKGDLDGNTITGSYIFTVSHLNAKENIDVGQSLLYILLTFSVLLFFCLSLYFSITIPYSNQLNNKGAVIKISKLKYIKLFCIMVSYALFVWFLNVLIGISDNFIGLGMYYGLISFLFNLFNNFAVPFSLGILVLCFFEIIKDVNIQKLINKFGST